MYIPRKSESAETAILNDEEIKEYGYEETPDDRQARHKLLVEQLDRTTQRVWFETQKIEMNAKD